MYRWESWWEHSKAYGKPITVEPTQLVLGAQLCAWEQGEDIEVSTIRRRLPAMSERLWSPDANRSYQDFAARLDLTDAALTRLLQARR
jgi:hexosaminidase